MPEGIRERNGRYQAYFDVNGRFISKTFDRQKDAVAWRRQKMTAADRGEPVEVGLQRLDRWMRAWLDELRPTWSEGTYTRYESVVRNHIAQDLGHWRLDQLSVSRIQTWVNGLEPSLAHSNLPVLRAGLQEAVRRELMRRNPARLVRLPTYKSRPMTFLEPSELRDVLELEPERWKRDAILGLAFTGARISEFADIRPEDVNPLKGTIHLRGTKTTSADRTIAIAGPIEEIVERRLLTCDEYVWEMDGQRGKSQISPSGFRQRVWYPLREKADIEEVRVHDLRHTCASWLIKSGANPVQVAGWLGHAKPSLTLDTYSHLFSTDMESMASSLTSVWDAPERDNVVAIGV